MKEKIILSLFHGTAFRTPLLQLVGIGRLLKTNVNMADAYLARESVHSNDHCGVKQYSEWHKRAFS